MDVLDWVWFECWFVWGIWVGLYCLLVFDSEVFLLEVLLLYLCSGVCVLELVLYSLMYCELCLYLLLFEILEVMVFVVNLGG